MPKDDKRYGPTPSGDAISDPVSQITDILARLRYGVIQLTVHDGRLTQLDVTERRRFTS